jgi:hypothetical protein
MKYVPAKYALVSAFGLICMGGAAMACPNPALSSGGIPVSASDQIQSFQVMAGGENTLEACGLAALGTGQFRSAPDFSFDVSGMQGREMDLSVDSQCDPALLVNTADGQWLFNDDSKGLNPALLVSDAMALQGRVDVWVGTWAGGECAATLQVANRVIGAAPAPTPAPAPAPAPTPAPPRARTCSGPCARSGTRSRTRTCSGTRNRFRPAANCPNPNVGGPPISLASNQLLQQQGYTLHRYGQHHANRRQLPGVMGGGTATSAPQTSLFPDRDAGL